MIPMPRTFCATLLATAAILLAAGAVSAAEPRTVIVAADGTGDFKSIQAAVDAAPDGALDLYLIRVKPGEYREKIVVPADKGSIKILGEDPERTVLTYDDSAKSLDGDGKEIGTFASASVAVKSDDFVAENVTIANSFGEGSQAVALDLSGDRSILRNCRLLGSQDTLLIRGDRHFFEKCYVEGRVDFIFGPGTAYFDSCEIHSLGGGYITAASTSESHPHGFVFSRCRITSEPGGKPTFLGRPWRPFANVVFLETEMTGIRPEGWDNWSDPENEKTARFAEFHSSGTGAAAAKRVPWSRQLTTLEASAFTPALVFKWWQPNLGLTPERIAALAEPARGEWRDYLKRSRELRKLDETELNAELVAAESSEPIEPPKHGDFKLPSKPKEEWWKSTEAIAMAENAVSFQLPSGGWAKKVSMVDGPRKPGMHWTAEFSPENLWHYAGTFDNRATTEHMRLLAGVREATGEERYAKAFLKGLDYVLSAQFPNGGWPQVYPLEGGYHDNVTLNDNAMVHVLELLADVSNAKSEFAFVDDQRRESAKMALKRGVQCLLDAQVRQDGRRTVWCAQHDPISLVPVRARLMEPVSLSGGESQDVVEFLMALPDPSPGVAEAVNGTLEWFDRSRVTGLRKTERDGRTFYESDPRSSEVYWARFYDIDSNQPIFSGAQDGRIYRDFADFWKNSTTGYSYFSTRPERLLGNKRKEWRKKTGL